jgi:hypothetical protein
MTIMEFSKKYRIPYHIAYEATYKVPAISTMQRDREYPEDKLFDAASDLIEARINKHARLMSQANTMYINLHSTRAREGKPLEMPKVRRENQNL